MILEVAHPTTERRVFGNNPVLASLPRCLGSPLWIRRSLDEALVSGWRPWHRLACVAIPTVAGEERSTHLPLARGPQFGRRHQMSFGNRCIMQRRDENEIDRRSVLDGAKHDGHIVIV
jgi:hypothetical protein